MGDATAEKAAADLVEANEQYRALVGEWREATANMNSGKRKRNAAENRVTQALSARGGESTGTRATDPGNVAMARSAEVAWGTCTRRTGHMTEAHIRDAILDTFSCDNAAADACLEKIRSRRRQVTLRYAVVRAAEMPAGPTGPVQDATQL